MNATSLSAAGRLSPVLAACTLALAALASSAQATVQTVWSYNTGVDNNQIVLPDGAADLHYSVQSAPSGAPTAPVAQTVGSPLSPLGGWAPATSTSAWITPPASTLANIGDFLYRTTFDLTGYDLSAPVQLFGNWAADNTGLGVKLNGGDLIAAGYGGYTAVPTAGFTAANFLLQTFQASSGFVAGSNTLDFLIRNTGGDTGLRVEYEVSATLATVPEPPSWALVAVSLCGIGLLLQRRARGRA